MYRKNLDAAFLAAATTPGAANPLVTATENAWEEVAGVLGVKADYGENGVSVATGATTLTVDGDASTGDWDSAEANVSYGAGAWGNNYTTAADPFNNGNYNTNDTTPYVTLGNMSDKWKAFNARNFSGTHALSGNGTAGPFTVTLGINMAAQKRISAYQITGEAYAGGARNPKTWTLEGSNNGSFAGEQVIVDTRTNVANWGTSASPVFNCSNPGLYQYYRINVTYSQGDNYMNIDCFSLFEGTLTTTDHLITSNNLLSETTSLAPSTFVAKDESNVTISGDGKFLIAYSINGGAYSAQMEQSVFKALSASTFNSIIDLRFQIELVGSQKLSAISINSPSSGGLFTKTGSITLTVDNTTRVKLEEDGDIYASGNLIVDDAQYAGVRAVTTAAGTTNVLTTDYLIVFTGTNTQICALAACESGRELMFKNRSTGIVTINVDGSDTIDAALTSLVLLPDQMIALTGSGTNWLRVNSDVPSFVITYDKNGGTGTTPKPLIAGENARVVLHGGSGITDITKWNTAANGTGTDYALGAEITATANLTLYAVIVATFIEATGGVVTEIDVGGVEYYLHTITSTDDFEVTSISGNASRNEVGYLMIGGGGGGGGSSPEPTGGGGGGAGRFLEGSYTLTADGTFPAVVGTGGAGGVGGTGTGANGADSTIFGLTALGGGGGGAWNGGSPLGEGLDGGSGGGSGYNASGVNGLGDNSNGGFGNDGGDALHVLPAAGGGGGAGGAGANSTSSAVSGNGGAAKSSSITTVAVDYAGGGGAGGTTAGTAGAGGGNGSSTDANGSDAAANKGGGGGGAHTPIGGSARNGGAGGSGVIYLRYIHPHTP